MSNSYTYKVTGLGQKNKFHDDNAYNASMDDEKSNVYMSDIHSKSIIRGCTLFGRNTGGIELMQFVKALQAILLSHYTWAQEQQQTAVAELLTAVRASMKTGRVSQELSVLLNTIEPSSPQYLAVKLVQAEDVYRSCNADAYHRFVESVSAEAKAEIMQHQESFEKTLQADLSDIHLNFENGSFFFLFNIIFLLMYCISKISGKSIASNCRRSNCEDCKSCKFIISRLKKKYPYVFWFNCFGSIFCGILCRITS